MPANYLTISTPSESVRFAPDKIVYILADDNFKLESADDSLYRTIPKGPSRAQDVHP